MQMSSCGGCRERREKHEEAALDPENAPVPGRRICLLPLRDKKPGSVPELPALRLHNGQNQIRSDLGGRDGGHLRHHG